ncbi:MAG: hypothetical protein ABIG85_08135 [Chloroflexota bacterium]
MDATLTYHNGGAGIFQHVTGPFVGEDPVLKMAEQRLPVPRRPTFRDLAAQGVLPLVDGILDKRGFGALGQDPPASGWSALSSTQKWALGGGAVALVVLLGLLALRREVR